MSRRRNADGIREERINKIIQFIKADHKNGGLGIISNEIIDEVSGTKVDSNSKTVIRKSIPFVDNEYIIPIQLDDGGARRIQHTSYSFLSKEEYTRLHNTVKKHMIIHLQNNIHSIKPNTILHALGFPDDWFLLTKKLSQVSQT